MSDSTVRTEYQGFFSRLLHSFVGVLIGIVMIPVSIGLIGWNEYRTVHRTKGLLEAEQVVAEVNDPVEVQPQLENRLVHLVGDAATEEMLTDQDFNLALNALVLDRQVEMFQWVEIKESKSRDKLGGGRETVTTYEYQKRWHSGRISSEGYEVPAGHANPQPKYSEKRQVASKATVGAYRLRPALLEQLDDWESVVLKEEVLLAGVGAQARERFRLEGGYLYYSDKIPNPAEPKIGDLRIRFRAIEPMLVSILAMQKNSSLEPFRTSNGESVESIEAGEHTASMMFDGLRFQNSAIAWLLRLVGWLLSCVAFTMIAGPLQSVANVVPFFGRLVGIATFAIGFLLGSSVSLISIGIAWVAVRPVYGITLLVLAAVGFYVLFRRRPERQPPMATLVDA